MGKLYRMTSGLLTHGLSSFRLARVAVLEKQATQRTWELMSLIGLVRDLRPRVVVEIGSDQGGTLFCWAKLATRDATIISVDLAYGVGGGGEGRAERFRAYMSGDQTLKCLQTGSHLPETRDEMVGILNGRKIDFLFIDGDHSYSGVRADFENYAALVRPGGLIAFHDIEVEVRRLWLEVKSRYRSYEFIEPHGADKSGMGIGVLVQT